MFEPTASSVDDEATENEKGSVRRLMLARRGSRRPHERERLSYDLASRALEEFEGCTTVAAYVSYDSEPGTIPLIEELHASGVRILVPKLGPGLSREWAWYVSTEDLEVRAPGRPPEPSGDALGTDALSLADAVLVPALAVDIAGIRLGRGAGWYDRALLHRRPGTPAYATVFDDEFLVDRTLPRDSHEVPVTHVLMPSRTIELSPETLKQEILDQFAPLRRPGSDRDETTGDQSGRRGRGSRGQAEPEARVS